MKVRMTTLTIVALTTIFGPMANARTFGRPRWINENSAEDRYSHFPGNGPASDFGGPRTMPRNTYAGWSPAEVCASVSRQVQYASDAGPEDQWKDAQHTWDTGKGDCEDFAVCVKQRCAEEGAPAEVYRVYPADGQKGHVITIGNWQGRTWMSSNGSYAEVQSVDDGIRTTALLRGWDPDGVTVVVGEPEPARGIETASSWGE